MNVLLIYPRYPDTFWSFKYVLKFISKKSAYPPLGLLTVAAMLPKEWNLKLVDTNTRELEDEQIAWADMVFVSAMLVQQEDSRKIIRRCKVQDKVVVAGGPAFTAQYEKYDEVDHFVLDEAELTLPPFLKDLREGYPKHLYTSSEKPDVAESPIPLWSLINFDDYVTMSVQYSRGCPYDCEFCDIIIMNGRRPRTKTPGQIVREFQSLFDAGWKGSVFIVDDNFIGNKVKVKKMLPELIKWQEEHNYPYKIITEASTNLADDKELMQLMSRANFYKVFLGIETPCVESLKECGKKQNVIRDLVGAVKTIHQNGMQVMGGFIVGFDNDKESIFETQINFIQQIGVVTAMVGLLNALPRTKLWKRLKSEGRLRINSTGDNTDGALNFIPRMGEKKLVEGYRKVVSTIYSPKFYYKRINTFIRSYNPTAKGRNSLDNYKALIRSIWNIGILSGSRFLFWKLMVNTFFTKIKALPVAIELAILGIHFEKVAKKTFSI